MAESMGKLVKDLNIHLIVHVRSHTCARGAHTHTHTHTHTPHKHIAITAIRKMRFIRRIQKKVSLDSIRGRSRKTQPGRYSLA